MEYSGYNKYINKKISKILEVGLLKLLNPNLSFRKIGNLCSLNHITVRSYLFTFGGLLHQPIKNFFLESITQRGITDKKNLKKGGKFYG